MARFPATEKNIISLGKLLAEAATNPQLRKKLAENPQEELRRIGLPERTVELLNFKVVVEKEDEPPTIVLPFKLNDQRLLSRDPEYLTQLAKLIPENTIN